MPLLLVALPEFLSPVAWTLLGVFAALGLVALVSPKLFATLAVRSGRWVDTSQALAKLDRPIHVDELVLPHSRLLGAAVLVSVGVLAFVLFGL